MTRQGFTHGHPCDLRAVCWVRLGATHHSDCNQHPVCPLCGCCANHCFCKEDGTLALWQRDQAKLSSDQEALQ